MAKRIFLVLVVVIGLNFTYKFYELVKIRSIYSSITEYLQVNRCENPTWQALQKAGFTNEQIAISAARFLTRVTIVINDNANDYRFEVHGKISDNELEQIEPILLRIMPFEGMIDSIHLSEARLSNANNESEKEKYQKILDSQKAIFQLTMSLYRKELYDNDVRLFFSLVEKAGSKTKESGKIII